MKTITVKEMMVPIEEYATVKEDENLYQAVLALEEAQRRFSQDRYKHRAVLVYDHNDTVVGKLSQLDAIRGLESGYRKIGDLRGVEHTGFSPELFRSMMQRYSLWQQPLDDICRRAPHIKVKDIMHTPTEGEYVDEEATLDQAIHQLVIGRHQSLLVTKGDDIVGILRLTDVFAELCTVIKTCQL